jgi:hypothetical protein
VITEKASETRITRARGKREHTHGEQSRVLYLQSAAAAARGDVCRFAVEKLAPKTVGVAAGLDAPGKVPIQHHAAVIRAGAAGRVLIAIADIEDFEGRIG